ncbi:MAG: RecX family transcriptional regulator [Bacteroidales bacterium]|nr:RecX family transcriptional regulator [Bacteroidales bacterium]
MSRKNYATKEEATRAMLDRARRYCAMSEQCESGVRQKLIAWGATPDEVDPIVERLRAEAYLDDERYARTYCESKILQQHWGRQKVLYQLRLKRLPKETIDACLTVVDDETYYGILRDTAARKREELGETPDTDRRLLSFLATRGFTMNEINKAIN